MLGRYQRLTSITSSSQRPTCMEKGAAKLEPSGKEISRPMKLLHVDREFSPMKGLLDLFWAMHLKRAGGE